MKKTGSQQKIKFTPEMLRELQLKELEGLIYFKKICDENNLLFYFCGGCCIGTLRHGGFIPWDDDIDIFMPRDDYERLYTVWKKKSDNPRFKLLRNDRETFVGNIFTTIVDTKYTCVKDETAHLPIPHGLSMDVFPLDGCPNGFKRKMQIFWAMIYSLFAAQIVPIKHGGMVKLGGKTLLWFFRGQKIRRRIWRFAEKKMSRYKITDCEYITELCAGPHYMMNKYPKQYFESAVFKTFEGLSMPLPTGYDGYLKTAFGDYMTIPPKEKQKPHHNILFIDLNKSCL